MSTDQTADALKAAGFDPPPYVGQEWVDPSATWLPDGDRHVVTVTALGNTVSGWQARVMRRQVGADGRTVPSGHGEGVIHVERLVREFEAVQA